MCCDYRALLFVLVGSIFIIRGTPLPQNSRGKHEARVSHDVFVNSTTDVIEVRRKSRVVIDCLVTSLEPILEYTWFKDGEILLPQKRVNTSRNGSLIIDKFLSKQRRNDSGVYECFVTNSFGTFIGTRVYVVNKKPTVNLEPRVADVIKGGVARLQCQIGSKSNQPLSYGWTHDTNTLASNNRVFMENGVLQIYNVTEKDAGNYVCHVIILTKDVDIPQKSALLNVIPGSLSSIPKLLNTTQNITVEQGKPALLECLVEGGIDVLITWTDGDGEQIIGNDNGPRIITGHSNLLFSRTVSSDKGTYTCVVIYANGQVRRRKYTLDVLEAPRFLEVPESAHTMLAQTTRLKCKADGNPLPDIAWYKDGYRLYPVHGKTLTDMVILKGRQEDAGYYQCVANNSVGIAIVTAFVAIKRNEYTPEPVQLVVAVPFSATKVRVTWAPAVAQDSNPVISYLVDYQRVHESMCPGRCRHLTESIKLPTGQTIMWLNDLEPYTNYSISVQAFCPSGGGYLSTPVTVRTLEAVPSGYPNIQISDDSSTSFRVTWSELPESTRHGEITSYKLLYGTKQRMMTVVQLSAETREYLVTDVGPDTTYEVRVLGGNSQGYPDGDDNWITYRTPKATQNETSNTELTMVPLNATAVLMSWSSDGSTTDGTYRVMIQKLIHGGAVTEYDVTMDTHKLTIASLEHREFYKIDFYVRNKNNDVVDHVTEVYQSVAIDDEQEPPPPMVLEPSPVTTDSISMSWNDPKTVLNIVEYTVSYQLRANEFTMGQARHVTTKDRNVTLRALQPFTWYVIAVRSHTPTAYGPFSKPIIIQTKEGIPSPPENLIAEVVSPGTVKLKWGPPREQNGIITYYIIYYNSDRDEPDMAWSSIQQNASTTSVVFQDLTSEIYYFKLRACTNAGKGDESHIIMIETSNCDACPECPPMSSCRSPIDKSKDSSTSVGFEQRLGIIIGCGVGILCIIICITFVVYKQRQLRKKYAERAESLMSARHNENYLRERNVYRYRHENTYSPMLARMIENKDFSCEPEVESVLLAPSTIGSDIKTECSTLDMTESTADSLESDNFCEPVKVHDRSVRPLPADSSFCADNNSDDSHIHIIKSDSNHVLYQPVKENAETLIGTKTNGGHL